ncbi:hypothetical protein B0H19DRAFT_1088313 [Mycena capillaripes]|nr:hypothetical protein B0H19DRAFT_1088313 [Mycena capillaripes]
MGSRPGCGSYVGTAWCFMPPLLPASGFASTSSSGNSQGTVAPHTRPPLVASSLPLHHSSEQIEEQITKHLVAILHSKDDMRAVGQLGSRDVQSFLDAIQEVLNRGSIPSSDSRSWALRVRQKLFEAHDQLPSSLFIDGVHDHDESDI